MTCGLRIAIFPTPARQIKNLTVQIAAKRSSAYAIPQPADTLTLPLTLGWEVEVSLMAS
jgi:hypothetical protein